MGRFLMKKHYAFILYQYKTFNKKVHHNADLSKPTKIFGILSTYQDFWEKTLKKTYELLIFFESGANKLGQLNISDII